MILEYLKSLRSIKLSESSVEHLPTLHLRLLQKKAMKDSLLTCGLLVLSYMPCSRELFLLRLPT